MRERRKGDKNKSEGKGKEIRIKVEERRKGDKDKSVGKKESR